jgi:hypothetical protein
VVLLGVVIFAIFDFAKFKQIVFQAMLIAKSKAKDLVLKSGQEQEDWVVEKVYNILPARIKLFVSKEILRNLVKKFYKEAKDYLDDGKFNDSVR